MYNTPGSGTLNGNSGGQEEARPQPIPSGEGVGREADYPPELGTRRSEASGLCPEAPAGHSGYRATSGRVGVQTSGDASRAEFNGFGSNPPFPRVSKLTYAEKLRDVRWKRRRDELLKQANYTCCQCPQPLMTGTMDLQVHHVVYIPSLDPWDYPNELLLVVCDRHHRERQAVEQAIYIKVGEHLAGLTIEGMRLQPIYAFHEESPMLAYLPAWMRDCLEYHLEQAGEKTIGCTAKSCPLRDRIFLHLAAGIP